MVLFGRAFECSIVVRIIQFGFRTGYTVLFAIRYFSFNSKYPTHTIFTNEKQHISAACSSHSNVLAAHRPIIFLKLTFSFDTFCAYLIYCSSYIHIWFILKSVHTNCCTLFHSQQMPTSLISLRCSAFRYTLFFTMHKYTNIFDITFSLNVLCIVAQLQLFFVCLENAWACIGRNVTA